MKRQNFHSIKNKAGNLFSRTGSLSKNLENDKYRLKLLVIERKIKHFM